MSWAALFLTASPPCCGCGRRRSGRRRRRRPHGSNQGYSLEPLRPSRSAPLRCEPASPNRLSDCPNDLLAFRDGSGHTRGSHRYTRHCNRPGGGCSKRAPGLRPGNSPIDVLFRQVVCAAALGCQGVAIGRAGQRSLRDVHVQDFGQHLWPSTFFVPYAIPL